MRRLKMMFLGRLVPIGLGAAFGLSFVLTSPVQAAPLWPVWAAFAVALTTTAGAIFSYGLDRWADLTALSTRFTLRLRDVAPRVAAIAALTLLVIVIGSVRLLGLEWSTARPIALLTVTILGGVPAAAVMDGVRRAAAQESAPGVIGGHVAVLIRLRQLLRRLLAAVGSLVALSTLATGAWLVPQRGPVAGSDVPTELPPQFVLISGGLGSLLVAVFYVPAATALQRRGHRLSDEMFPLDEATDAVAVLNLADSRHRLEQLLGMDRGVIADLQTGLAILGPLLASAAAAFLSPS